MPPFRIAACATALALGALPALAGSIVQTNLVSDGTIPAPITDPNLVNPWGISYSPTGPFWVSDNHTGLTTLYNGEGQIQNLVVTIPPAAGATGPSAPTGQAFNATTDFVVSGNGQSGPAAFLFATENGTISGWSPSVDLMNAVNAIDNSASNAVYKGLALYSDSTGNYLLAANFRAGLVEVYDGSFHLVTKFRDNGRGAKLPPIPSTYSPFNVAVFGNRIFVTYAKVDASRHDNLDGPGTGFVDEVRIDGELMRRIASHGSLSAPWGMAKAPANWGKFANALLVGNFGNGWIDAYRIADGAFLGLLKTPSGSLVTIPGLWGLIRGNGGAGGSRSEVYFAAGPSREKHGLFGSLTYVP